MLGVLVLGFLVLGVLMLGVLVLGVLMLGVLMLGVLVSACCSPTVAPTAALIIIVKPRSAGLMSWPNGRGSEPRTRSSTQEATRYIAWRWRYRRTVRCVVS